MAKDAEEEEEEEGEAVVAVEKLEAEVTEMARRVLDYRTTLPRQLTAALSSTLSAQRSLIPDTLAADVSDPGPSTDTAEGAPSVEEDQETIERVQELKQRLTSNASAMPFILKRMRDVISRLDNQESRNVVIFPSCKKKKPI